MFVSQELGSRLTPAQRVVKHVLVAAQNGLYCAPARLPSERVLAQELAVSRNTVTAAYGKLEQSGVIRRIHGKGAYLCALPSAQESFSWSGKVSRFANALDEPVLELLARRCAGEVPYAFSAGTPSLDAFPKEMYTDSVQRVVSEAIPSALAVAPAEGQWVLRQALAAWLQVPPQHIMITAGAQEGIDLIARCMVEPGDHVIVDSPTYPGALQSFLSAGARLLPWGSDWSTGQLEELLLRYRPKLLFLMPTLHNPTGRVMSLKTRLAVLELTQRYKVPVIEDDVYGRMHFENHPMPSSLYALDQRAQVIHISTFSKMLAPGLRIGWLVAPPYMVKQLALIKMRSNLFTGGFNQLVLSDSLQRGSMDRHLESLRKHHELLCRAALEAIQPAVQRNLIRCRAPLGGLYLWCELMVPVDIEHFLVLLEQRGISVAPGGAFEPERGRKRSSHFRICFTALPREALEEGLQILVRTLEDMSSRLGVLEPTRAASAVGQGSQSHTAF